MNINFYDPKVIGLIVLALVVLAYVLWRFVFKPKETKPLVPVDTPVQQPPTKPSVSFSSTDTVKEGMEPPVSVPSAAQATGGEIVVFSGAHCPHSRAFVPEFTSTIVPALQKIGVTGRVLADTEYNPVEAGIKGVPSIRFYPNGYQAKTDPSTYTDYMGPRTAEGILAFVKQS